MSEEINIFKQLIDNRTKKAISIQTEWAIVKEVDWKEKTMICIGQNNDLEYYNVLLGIGSIFKKPKIDSVVLIGSIDNSEEAFMVDCEEFEEFVIVSGNIEFKISAEGFLIKNAEENLTNILSELFDQVNNLNQQLQLVVVPNGVSPNVPALQIIKQSTTAIKQRLNSVLSL